MGVLLSFRNTLQEVLYDSMNEHAPFLMASVKDFTDNLPTGSENLYISDINEMSAAGGTGHCSF